MSQPAVLPFDHAATTPMDPALLQALHKNSMRSGHPWSRQHRLGRQAHVELELAREGIATEFGCSNAKQVLFTSGATESIRVLIHQFLEHARRVYPQQLPTVVTSTIEHRATRVPLQHYAECRQIQWNQVSVTAAATLNMSELQENLKNATGPVLVSVILGHNEFGTLQSARALAELCEQYGAWLHLDAAQVWGKGVWTGESADPYFSPSAWITISAHKRGGPHGVGALIAPKRTQIEWTQADSPEIQAGLGTPALPWIELLRIWQRRRKEHPLEERESGQQLRTQARFLWDQLREKLPTLQWVGEGFEERVPGHLSMRLPGMPASQWMLQTPGVAFSAGSACSNVSQGPASLPLGVKLGMSASEAAEVIRLVLWRSPLEQSQTQVQLQDMLVEAAERLRKGATPSWNR